MSGPLLTRTAAPSALISTADAKTHLNVDFSDDDTYIDTLVSTATAALDGPYGIIGKALVTQSWQAEMWPVTGRTEVYFPVTPMISLSSIHYYDTDNAQQSLTVGDFDVFKDEDKAIIVPQVGDNWPTMYCRRDALTITASCGFGAAASVPANIVHAAKIILTNLYENRGEMPAEMPSAVKALIGVSRSGWVG